MRRHPLYIKEVGHNTCPPTTMTLVSKQHYYYSCEHIYDIKPFDYGICQKTIAHKPTNH